jgi:hypothetical protein
VRRRDHLLRRYARLWGAEPEEVAQLVRTQAQRPCLIAPDRAPTSTARLGDDGRYHLCRDGQPVCATSRVRGVPGRYRHNTRCSWWYLDGQRRFGVSHAPDVDLHAVKVTWTVELLDGEHLPAAIAPSLRCSVPLLRWPPYAGSATPIARIRARLIEVLGPDCALCGDPGQHVDHDHDSGLVRGLLCGWCNNLVDLCPHPTGCPFADYLNNPPAEHLAIRYPNRGRNRPRPMPSAAERRARRAELAARTVQHSL